MFLTKNTAMAVKTKNAGVSLTVKAEGDTGIIEGYASIWDVVDSYNEVVVKGAFRESLAAASATSCSSRLRCSRSVNCSKSVQN